MNNKHQFGRTICALAGLVIIPCATAQLTFDLAADFSASQNPNGAWSFGWMASDGTDLNLYTTPFPAYGLGLNEWRGTFPNNNGSAPPDVICNPTDVPITVSDTTWLPHKVTFHPGEHDERSVIRWTSPFAGPASLMAAFEGCSGSATSGVEIYQNDILLFAGAVLGTDAVSRLNFATNLVLQIGDTIDCRVDYGNGNWASDTTQVGVVITAVPAPALTILRLPSDSARLVWTTNNPGYHLESASEIPATSWSPITNPPVVQDGRFVITVGTSNQSQFFRLRKQ